MEKQTAFERKGKMLNKEKELTPPQQKMLNRIENFECFWSPKNTPLNANRRHEELPEITKEQVIERRKELIDSFFGIHGRETVPKGRKNPFP